MQTRRSLALLAVLAIAMIGALQARQSAKQHPLKPVKTAPTPASGTFDYYVMALSWSPTFCETHPEEDEQCSHKGYGFILHGLWPQFEAGGGPERCPMTVEPDRKTIANTLAFMPSRRLINHEWTAHGTCTGLDPAAYFALADRAFAAVQVPVEFKAPQAPLHVDFGHVVNAFKQANTNLTDDMLSLHCSRGELVEVRVCLTKDMAPRSCGARMPSHCSTTAEFDMPASR